jgi:multiple sugar transport system substrate-binding protein
VKKIVLKSILLGAAILGLSGCGNSADNQITLWNPFTGKDGDYFQEIVDAYNKTNPDIKIKNVVIPDMYTKINTVMNSNKDKDVPDLTVMHAERVELFQSQDLVTPMTDVLADQKEINENNYIEQAWASGEVGGVRYTVPLDVHSSPMFYNVDLLNKYGPTALDDGIITVEEIDEIAKKAKVDGKITYPVNLELWTSMSFVTELGGSIEKDGKPNVDTPEMKEAIGILKHFVDSGAAQEDGDDAVQLFQSGESVFLQDGTWGIAGHKEIEGLNYGITNTPSINGKTFSNWTSSHQFGLLKKERSEEKMKAIGEFIEFVRKNSDVWAESGQNVASKEIFESPDYKEYMQSFLVSDPKELASLKIYDFKNNGITLDSLGVQLRDMVYGRLDISEGLKEAQKEADDKLKEGA